LYTTFDFTTLYRVDALVPNTSSLFGVLEGNSSETPIPNAFVSVGVNNQGAACGNFGSGCDAFQSKLQETIHSTQNRNFFDALDSLCKDPSNSTAFSTALSYHPLLPPSFSQFCWMAAMEKFQDQPYPPEQVLNTWQDVVTTLTVYDMAITVNHPVLFAGCAPISCSYASVHFPSAAGVVSYATSLYGGVASIAGSIYAALWAFNLKHSAHKRKKSAKQEQQIAKLRETAQQLDTKEAPSAPSQTASDSSV